MRRFAALYLDLDSTNSTNDKVRLLESYLHAAPDEDAAWAVALLLGERPRGGASSAVLRSLLLESTGLPEWLLEESYAAVGDFSETAALLAPGMGAGADEPLHVTMRDRVLPLAGAAADQRARIIREAWAAFGPRERLVFHKLARGGFRVGVQRRLVARGLATLAGVEASEMMLRLSGPVRPEAAWYRALLEGDGDRPDRPYPFFLAHPLDANPESLGPTRAWQAEWKWDGVRAQLIRRDAVLLWSRGEEPLTEQFPEIVRAARGLPEGLVLDGEVLMWRGDRPLPFAALQRRLGRKIAPTAQAGLFEQDEAVFLAFDLLEFEGADMRPCPLRERRLALERVLRLPGSLGDTLRLSPILRAESWTDLARLRSSSRERGVEGLLLKRLDSAYGVGRTTGDEGTAWWKWKVDPYSIDAVLVYAQPGSGRRAGLLTDYTFAVWEDAGEMRRLTPFAKAYSGLTNGEIESLDAWIRRHTLSRNGPVRLVAPKRVFEIHFEGIGESERHRPGIAVRFPRIARERTDKPAAAADTIESLRALLRAGR